MELILTCRMFVDTLADIAVILTDGADAAGASKRVDKELGFGHLVCW